MVTPVGPNPPLINSGLTRYRSHNRLSQERISQEFAKIDFYHHNERQAKKSGENLVLDEVNEEKLEMDSPNKNSVSPLRRHQKSINIFLDTMK